jgi:hypothetical protein
MWINASMRLPNIRQSIIRIVLILLRQSEGGLENGRGAKTIGYKPALCRLGVIFVGADPIITLKEPDMSNAEMQREPAVAGTIDMKLEVD